MQLVPIMDGDLVRINDYIFSVAKYQNAQKKEEACKQIIEGVKKMQTNSKQFNQYVQFCYDHMVKDQSKTWVTQYRVRFDCVEKYFSQIYFSKINALNLNSNNITNIESLSSLNAPEVQTFQLYGNPIYSIKAFAKNLHFPKLKNLTLYRSCVSDFDSLHRLNASKLFYLELDVLKEDPPVCQDCAFVFKLPIKTQQNKISVWCSSKTRIIQTLQNYEKIPSKINIKRYGN